MENRVVVTGMGALTPTGLTVQDYWQTLLKGQDGIGPVTYFDASDFTSQIVGELKGFEPSAYFNPKEARRFDPFVQYALAATTEAIADSGLDLDALDKSRAGVIVSSGIGGIATLEKQHSTLLNRGPGKISPFFIPMMISDMAPGQISIQYGFKGPNYTTVSACASAGHAIGDAYRILQRGDADVMIAGGTEATITPLALAGFCAMQALSTRNDEPHRASRPFDAQRDGFVMGEGAGILVLETLNHAQARGASIHGELVGCAYTADAYHITAPAPGGEGAARVMKLALEDAELNPQDVDYINAHGTSTPLNDKFETAAIKTVFGEHAHNVPISSTKSMIGHLLGAAAGVELIAALMSIRDEMIHPTVNYEHPDPECDLDYVPNESRKCPVRVAISNSFGFGGHNVTLVVRKFEPK
ncbi:MAG: 3-oxoacyl-ACP synthase [candidate division Zixibacteria bacterium SM23_81]|nr:MAG: 3-oxoacyl-ACP synthase [candidate division Zixibacteria bacterium SM23_81]